MKRFMKPSAALLAVVLTLGACASQRGQSALLFYQAGTGAAATAGIDPLGNFQTFFSYSDFSPDWTHVVNAGRDSVLPDGNNAMLFYNANNGNGATGFISDDAEFFGQLNYTGLSAGWTHVVGAGVGLVLLYDQAIGFGATKYIGYYGDYTDLKFYDDFIPWWTHIVCTGFDGLNLKGYLLFYNADTGAVATGSIDWFGNFTTLQTYANFSTGWTHVAACFPGLVLFYDANSGNAVVGFVDADGNYSHLAYHRDLGPNWTHIVGDGYNALFYNANTGAGMTGSFDEFGTFTTANTYDNFSPGWTHISGSPGGY